MHEAETDRQGCDYTLLTLDPRTNADRMAIPLPG
jgi:hypothetical protein